MADTSLLLSDDCWYNILAHVDGKTVAAFGMTSKRNHQVSKAWFLWKPLFQQEWGFQFWRGVFVYKIPTRQGWPRDDYMTLLYRPDKNISNYHQVGYDDPSIVDDPDCPSYWKLISFDPLHDRRGGGAGDWELDWRRLYYENKRLLRLWTRGETTLPQQRVVIAGPAKSGKSSLLAAMQHYARGGGHIQAVKELQEITPPALPFDHCHVASITKGETEMIFCELEAAFSWMGNFRGAPVNTLFFCVDLSTVASMTRSQLIEVYDHLHGMLGEAQRQRVRLCVVFTKADLVDSQKSAVDQAMRMLRIEDLGECGWYLSCHTSHKVVSCFNQQEVLSLLQENKGRR